MTFVSGEYMLHLSMGGRCESIPSGFAQLLSFPSPGTGGHHPSPGTALSLPWVRTRHQHTSISVHNHDKPNRVLL